MNVRHQAIISLLVSCAVRLTWRWNGKDEAQAVRTLQTGHGQRLLQEVELFIHII